ncbi:LytR/AlgR family response regulator transcription factor [Maribellus maritimus]|uniref:LytR/AlgR family response regulator transcription factor n=1 Tax=Maribellus maritimus TaxID=2870838 RepID=UPI001EE9FE38|nr:LytTR family DNA-binding domain-containing protein [Maribellus maritimus]MCG6191176.1 LytTR family DNA-binding domain-containing protein [Maribellus maritimus]
MKILIIEDEERAAVQLINMIRELVDDAKFFGTIENIEDAVTFLSEEHSIDLIFLDIHLSDGSSFEIFREVKVDVPVIFTTAYDQYAIQAFELNSVDYLLKPIRLEKLNTALQKYNRLHNNSNFDRSVFQRITSMLEKEKHISSNFLIPVKDKLVPVATNDFAWFEISDSVVTGMKFDQKSLIMEQKSLEELTDVLDSATFYRANRQYLINRKAIKEIEFYFNGRLLVKLFPFPKEKVLISKARASDFKGWLKLKY